MDSVVEKQVERAPGREGLYNGRLAFYHPTASGSGGAARFELKLGRGEREKCVFLEMARQQPAGSGEGSGGRRAAFDWKGKATVKLGFMDLCELLAVLEGRQQQAGDGRGGLYHAAAGQNTLIGFRAGTERPGYLLSISRKGADGRQVFKGHVVLSVAEGLGLRCVLQATLFHMAFHDSVLAAAA
jgi:hypothetical protein